MRTPRAGQSSLGAPHCGGNQQTSVLVQALLGGNELALGETPLLWGHLYPHLDNVGLNEMFPKLWQVKFPSSEMCQIILYEEVSLALVEGGNTKNQFGDGDPRGSS